MSGQRTFQIDAFPESAFRYLDRDAVVCIDVICSTTMIVSAVAQGRHVFPVAGTDRAREVAAGLGDSILAGEVEGARPEGFEMASSPAALALLTEDQRPLVLTAPGTQLIVNAGEGNAVYVACYRNISATAAHLAKDHRRVVILGDGVGGEFRCEDQMAAAMLGRLLIARGFDPEDVQTADVVDRWSKADLALASWGKSAADLRKRGRLDDLRFVLDHFDDLDLVCRQDNGEVRAVAEVESTESGELAAVAQASLEEWGNVLPFSLWGRPGAWPGMRKTPRRSYL